MNTLRTTGLTVVLAAFSIIVAGCESSAESGTLIGAGGGALAGQAIGRNTTGTLIGAGVGAVGGYIVGNEMDKKKAAQQQDVTGPRQGSGYQSSQSYNETTTVTIRNSNGSTTPVLLQKQGYDWVGPKGEHYNHLPTEAELKPVYGL